MPGIPCTSRGPTWPIVWTLLVALLPFGSRAAHAFSVDPLLMELTPLGEGSRASLRVFNESAEPQTIEIDVARVTHDANGGEQLVEAEDALLVFPPLAIVQPGGTQVVQVQYIGDPELASSETFRVLVEDVPVTLGGGQQSSVAIRTSVQALLHVVPTGTLGKARITDIAPAANGQWHVSVTNDGKRYVRLADTRWTMDAGAAGSLTLEGDEIDRRIGPNLVLPGTSRRFLFDPPNGFPAEGTTITIDSAG